MTRLEIQALSRKDISETRSTCYLSQIEEKLKHQENDVVDENTYKTRHTLEAPYTSTSVCHTLIASILIDQVDNGFAVICRSKNHFNVSQPLGYCFINNVVVEVNKIIKDKKATKIAVIDWDVHLGDGTETLT